ncbi:NUDIX hydrolase YfcD [Thermodesulfobacteriota bacterium]
MKPKDEIVSIVDEENNLIGTEFRSVMRLKGLIHRASYILVFNSKEQIFVQKRTLTKDVYPGYYDVAAGGVVLAGETYEESAERELEEELGIRGVSLKRLFDFYYQHKNNRVWGRAFACVYDGRIVLQEEEVESGGFRDVNEVVQAGDHEQSTPDSLYVLRRCIQERI